MFNKSFTSDDNKIVVQIKDKMYLQKGKRWKFFKFVNLSFCKYIFGFVTLLRDGTQLRNSNLQIIKFNRER